MPLVLIYLITLLMNYHLTQSGKQLMLDGNIPISPASKFHVTASCKAKLTAKPASFETNYTWNCQWRNPLLIK